jgi:hypothetical protein
MNKQKMLDWLINEAALKADQYYDGLLETRHESQPSIDDLLYELNGRSDLELPRRIPGNPEEAPEAFAEENPQFHHRVDLISLLLRHYYPDKYLFFRPSKLDFEIFAGLEYFAEIREELDFPFSHVSKYNIKEYLEFNRAMLKLGHAWWPGYEFRSFFKGKPRLKPAYYEYLQKRVAYFLYQGVAELFLEKNEYNRYWLIATKENYFDLLDRKSEVSWSGRKEMQVGDIVFAYRMSPRKAITDIYRVSATPYFDPYYAWDGFWVDLDYVSPIPDIPFATMRTDDVLKECQFIRKSFQGSVTESIPHRFYNRLLDFIPQGIKDEIGLVTEKIAITGSAGDFNSEAEFEEQVIAPILKRWGFKYKQQNPCVFHVGGQIHKTRIDFVVSDERALVTLFEDKIIIVDEKMLASAREQAKSYALMLGLSSFVVASPEGMWVYSLKKNVEKLEAKLSSEELARGDEKIRSLLLKLR